MEDDKKIKKETKKRLEASLSTMGWATNLLTNNKKIWEKEENDSRGEPGRAASLQPCCQPDPHS